MSSIDQQTTCFEYVLVFHSNQRQICENEYKSSSGIGKNLFAHLQSAYPICQKKEKKSDSAELVENALSNLKMAIYVWNPVSSGAELRI